MPNCRYSYIFYLQTNKALGVFDIIQTIDSLGKAAAIDKRVERARRKIAPDQRQLFLPSDDS